MKRLRIIALMFCLLFCMTSAAQAAGFTDVKTSSWYYSYVTDLSQKGIIAGYPDGTFGPDNLVRWDEALKLVLLAAQWPEQPADQTSWAGGYLSLAERNGWISAPVTLSDQITREQVCRLAARAMGLQQAQIVSPFADCTDSEILSLVEAGIIEGIRQGDLTLFLADGLLHRSEISAIIWRMEQYMTAHPELAAARAGGIPSDQPQNPPEAHPGKILYKGEYLDIMENVPVFSYRPESFSISGGRMTCSDPSVELIHGIDVSAHQELVDWNRVKADGIDFVFLRAGYRGYTVGNLNEDKYFTLNLKNAADAGLRIGIYFYSQAITEEEALEEAEYVLQAVEGVQLDLPIVFDWEIPSSSTARTKNLPRSMITRCAKLFCTRIAEEGYTPAIYFNQSWGYLKFDLSQLAEYSFWFAQYRSQPDFYYHFDYWQYSSSGKVDGVNGKVDLDVWIRPVSH